MSAQHNRPVHAEGEGNLTYARHAWNAAVADHRIRSLLERDAKAFLHQSLSTPCLSAIKRAQGIWIEDLSGQRYMDFHGNSVHHIGYGHPRLVQAIKDQMDALSFSPRRFTSEPAILLAEKLAEIAPSNLSKILFTTGGSDAIEVALKIARAATGRFKTLSFWDAFHGAGFGASSIGGEATFRSGIAGPLLPGAEHVAPWAASNCPYGQTSVEASAKACANMISYILEREGDIAAFIAEPMRATPNPAPAGFWKKVRQACDRHGTLLIFDEIPTGLGKTGKFFACEHEEVTPDIIVLGKALGGGILPIAAVVAREDLDVAGDYAIGHYTHEKNPVTARAALTTIEIIEDEGLVERARNLGAYALERLQQFAQHEARIANVRGRGLIFGIELVNEDGADSLAEKIFYRCLNAGLSFKITQGNILTLSPPLIISREELDQALDILEAAISAA